MARAETARGFERSVRPADLLVWLWRLLASAQFAIALIGFLAVAGLVAVLLPQIPQAMQGNPIATEVWLEDRRDTYGAFTEAMHRAGLFNVVDTWWFVTGLALLLLSIGVYTVDRLAASWTSITRPRERLPESFFDRAANRIAVAAPAERVEALLRRRRYRVRSFAGGGTTYLFADRYAWAQLGNFLSHAAIALFIIGALISRTGGFSASVFVAEGETSPVFPVSHPDQMLVEVVDAVGAFDAEGRARDFRSELVIYRDGEAVARGEATVNDPLEYGGYRFHQSGYLGEGAALRVRDASTGNTQYAEVLALGELVPAPAVTVRDASGAVVLSDVIVPTDFLAEASGTLIALPGTDREYWVGVTEAEEGQWRLTVFEAGDEGARLTVAEGESLSADGVAWTFDEVTGLPSLVVDGVPGDNARGLVVMAETPEGEPYLTLLGPVDGRALTLYAERPVRAGGLEYTFEGRREFAGIDVRKDPGANFIWAATGLLLAGLALTFYVPRLRLWARVRGGEAVIAAQAERAGVFRAEAERLAAELGPEGKDTR